MGAPSPARKIGKSGKMASLETSLSRLARPSSQTRRGSERSACQPPASRLGAAGALVPCYSAAFAGESSWAI